MHWLKTHFFTLAIAGVILFFTLTTFLLQRERYLARTDLAAVGNAYGQSQYVKGDATPAAISDAVVYLYAADAYMKGQDPTSINFEHPPLGKYLIGISLRVFGNGAMLNLLLLPVIMWLWWRVSVILRLSSISQFLTIALIGSSSLMTTYASEALLDIFQLFFVSLFLWLVLTKRHWAMVGIVFGLLISTKYFVTVLFVCAIIVWLGLGLRKAICSVLLAFAVYLGSYAIFFLHHSPLDWLRFEWYRFRWWTGNQGVPKFLIFQTIFFGKYPKWWEAGEHVQPNWNLSWPVFLLSALASLRWVRQRPAIIIAFYTFATLGFFALSAASFERYLIHFLPGLIVLSLITYEQVAEWLRQRISLPKRYHHPGHHA